MWSAEGKIPAEKSSIPLNKLGPASSRSLELAKYSQQQ